MDKRRERPAALTTATDEERAHARESFRRKLAEAQKRATPEKRAKLRAALGFDTPAA